jgi:hypothetical protein
MIIVASWVSVATVAVAVVLEALGLDVAHGATVALSLTWFLVSLAVWTAAFALAVVRSSRGDEVTVGNLFFLSGSAPAPVRRHLMGALAASVVVAAAAMFVNPYVVLVPMLPLGLAGLWAARHGTFPPRRNTVKRQPARGDRR